MAGEEIDGGSIIIIIGVIAWQKGSQAMIYIGFWEIFIFKPESQ